MYMLTLTQAFSDQAQDCIFAGSKYSVFQLNVKETSEILFKFSVEPFPLDTISDLSNLPKILIGSSRRNGKNKTSLQISARKYEYHSNLVPF